MPITKLKVDDRISDWVYTTNDIIDEINSGIGDRQQLITTSKVVVSAINTIGGTGFWTETRLADGSVTTPKIAPGAVNGYKIADNPEFRGEYGRLPSGVTAERPYEGSDVSSVFFNGDADEEFIITGTGFDPAGAQVILIGSDGTTELTATVVTVVSSHIIKFEIPSDLDPALKPYSVKVINNNITGQPEVVSTGVLNFGGGPVWTSSGEIGDFEDYQSHLDGNVQFFLDARDPDKRPLEYSFVSGTLPTDASIFTTGTVNIPACPPQYVPYNSPTVFQFVASADDTINPAVNSGQLHFNVRPSNPETLLPNATMRAWFSGASFASGVWQDQSGNGHDTITQRGAISIGTWSGAATRGVTNYDADRDFKYISGGINDGLIFDPDMTPSVDQTYFIVARYTNTSQNQGRILTSKGGNVTFSHWGPTTNNYGNGNAGASHWNHWYVSNEDVNDYMYNHHTNWQVWAGNQDRVLSNGRLVNTRVGAAGAITQVAINPNDTAYAGGQELSDWAMAELIVFDGRLSEDDMRTVSKMLGWRYGIPMSYDVGDTPRVGIVHAPANRALGTWADDLPLTINWTAQSWSFAGNATYPLPDWADGALGTLNINTNNGAPTNDVGITNQYLVTDRPTIIRLYRNSGWNTVNDFGHNLSDYTRRTDLEAIWTGAPFSTSSLEIYERYVEAGVYTLDCDSALFQFFKPDPDTATTANQPTLLDSAVIWSKEPE